jgi:gluconate 2-dehydrogenase gamma chain
MATDMQYAYRYLIKPEVRFLEAAVEILIPTDELGPGARDAGVVPFIDGQLASGWGQHGRQYRSGPWMEGTPQQGWQSPLTPQELYRIAIRETNIACTARHGKVFNFLPVPVQTEILQALESGALELPSVSSALFFGLLHRNTMEGFFADPMYGGNRDKVGWRLIGFPGVAASDYNDHLLQHNEAYAVEPVSILDLVQDEARADSQGYARHIPLHLEPKA